jgi:hypothetical protein
MLWTRMVSTSELKATQIWQAEQLAIEKRS